MSWIAAGATAVTAGGSIAGSLLGGSGLSKQVEEMRKAIEYQKQKDAATEQRFQPYLNFGGEQLNNFGDWLNDPRNNPMSMIDPSFDFRRDQGMKTITGNAATAGLLNSGDTLRGLEDYGQNLASGEYGNAFNRWLQEGEFKRGNAGIGMNAAAQVGALENQGAANVGSLTANTDFAGPDMLLADAVSGVGGMGGNMLARRFAGGQPGAITPGGSNIFASSAGPNGIKNWPTA